MPMATRRRCAEPRPGGFTLLEVLVALTIIAVALAAALRGAMALTGNARDVSLRQYALMAAENRLLELRLQRGDVTTGESALDCPEGGIVFVCRQSVGPTPNPFFRRVEVHVWTPGDDPREFADLMALVPVN